MAKRTKRSVSTRVKNVIKMLGAGNVLDTYEDRDFVEVTYRIGGDVVTYRVYNNGMVTER